MLHFYSPSELRKTTSRAYERNSSFPQPKFKSPQL